MSEPRVGRVLVTGTAGFIGSHLAQRLVADGYEVVGLDRRPTTLTLPAFRAEVCDLLDAEHVRDVVRSAAPDAVLHLAARTDLDETVGLDAYAANTDGVRHLLAAIRATPSVRRAVCTSTQLVCRVGYRPRHDEDYAPNTVYGRSKVETERAWRADDGAGRTWTLVRPTTIWGPRMNPHYLRFFSMIRRGRYFHVGRGPTLKSYGYVRNAVHQYVRLLEAPAEQVHRRTFFLADYEPIALEAWADAFAVEFGARRIPSLPRPIASLAARIGDLVQAVGWRQFPFTSFRLNNVLTSYVVDTGGTEAVCGPLPVAWRDGVRETAAWLETALAA